MLGGGATSPKFLESPDLIKASPISVFLISLVERSPTLSEDFILTFDQLNCIKLEFVKNSVFLNTEFTRK
jgi:hypothetical protein